MKLLLLSLSLFLFAPSSSTDNVYICLSKTASKYHYSESCRGLNNCTHTISKVTFETAKEKGYTLCGWED